MNTKLGIAIALFALGILLIANGFWSMSHISSAEKHVERFADSRNPILRSLGEEAEELFGNHRSRARWSLIGGFTLVVVGAGAFLIFRKK